MAGIRVQIKNKSARYEVYIKESTTFWNISKKPRESRKKAGFARFAFWVPHRYTGVTNEGEGAIGMEEALRAFLRALREERHMAENTLLSYERDLKKIF